MASNASNVTMPNASLKTNVKTNMDQIEFRDETDFESNVIHRTFVFKNIPQPTEPSVEFKNVFNEKIKRFMANFLKNEEFSTQLFSILESSNNVQNKTVDDFFNEFLSQIYVRINKCIIDQNNQHHTTLKKNIKILPHTQNIFHYYNGCVIEVDTKDTSFKKNLSFIFSL